MPPAGPGELPRSLDALLELVPGIGDAFFELYELVTSRPLADPVVLELCRLRIAMLLGAQAELDQRHAPAVDAGLDEELVAELPVWTGSPRFDERQRAALAFAEQFLLDAKHLEAEIARLREVFSDQEVFVLTVAVALYESFQRWGLVLRTEVPAGAATNRGS